MSLTSEKASTGSQPWCNPVLAHGLSGAFGGVISRTCTAPADRVRTLMQSGLGVPVRPPNLSKAAVAEEFGHFAPRSKSRPCGPSVQGALRQAVLHIYHNDGGVKGFYRGNGVNCIKTIPDVGVQFAVNHIVTASFSRFNSCHDSEQKSPTLSQRILSGGIAGAASQTLIHPLDVIKTQMTVATKAEYSGGIFECVKTTAADPTLGRNVVTRLYRGYIAALLGIVPYMGAKLGLYNHICSEYRRIDGGSSIVHQGGKLQALPGFVNTIAAMSASCAGITVAYPLNLTRVKLQVQGVNGRSVLYVGVRDCLRKTVRYEGVVGLYRGFIPNLFKALPAQSILLVFQKRMCDWLLGQ